MSELPVVQGSVCVNETPDQENVNGHVTVRCIKAPLCGAWFPPMSMCLHSPSPPPFALPPRSSPYVLVLLSLVRSLFAQMRGL